MNNSGRIVAVGPHSRVPSPHEVETLEFPDGVLTPGLVNCHTHLELTVMRVAYNFTLSFGTQYRKLFTVILYQKTEERIAREKT